VVLAAVTRGFRDQLAGRGVLEPAWSYGPGSRLGPHRRAEGLAREPVSAVFVNLPVGEEDPLRPPGAHPRADGRPQGHQPGGGRRTDHPAHRRRRGSRPDGGECQVPIRCHTRSCRRSPPRAGPQFPIYILQQQGRGDVTPTSR
jgi:hypothetical protein